MGNMLGFGPMISQGPSNGGGIKSFGRGLASMELEATAGRGGGEQEFGLDRAI